MTPDSWIAGLFWNHGITWALVGTCFIKTFHLKFLQLQGFCARWNCSRCSGALVEWKNDGLGRCARAIYAKTSLLKDREGEEFGIENCQEIAHALDSMQWSAMPGIHPSSCLCTGTYVSLFNYAFASMCLRVSRVSMYLEMYAIGLSKGIIMKI